ncbi:MAG: hypothetical protein PHS54_03270 [Clostridia bacterium]|nr:hypothetical protein [Clostridia bacterium]
MKNKLKDNQLDKPKSFFKKVVMEIKWLFTLLRWLLFLPLSFFIASGLSFLFIEKCTEIKPDLFKYQFLTDLIPGLEAPNQSELLPYYIIAGILFGFGFIFIGTIIVPSKKFLMSWVLVILPTLNIIRISIFESSNIKLDDLFTFIAMVLAVVIIHPKKIIKLLKSRFGVYVCFGLLLTTVFLFGLFFYNKKSTKLDFTINKKMELEEKLYKDRVALDMNGDGIYEMLVNPLMADDYIESTESAKQYLTLYNSEAKKIATTPDWFGSAPNSSHLDFVTPPIGIELNDLAQIDVSIGPHQTETMFLKLEGDLLLPVCKVEKPNSIDDCLFYNSSGELETKGGMLGGFNDGKLGIIEFVDEYPSVAGKLDNKTKDMISNTFKDDSRSAIKIAEMEKNDKGLRVVWNIYVYNGKYFEAQTGENYDKYFGMIDGADSSLLKKTEMTKESVEYTEFAKDFWSGR